jgi:hypothetical protein
MGRKKKRKKGPPHPYKGLGSVLPRSGSSSIVTRIQTPMKGTTSGGLPSLGKKRK